MCIICDFCAELSLSGDNVVEKGDCRIKDESKDNRALVDK